MKATQVYDKGSWCILIDGVEVWRDEGGANYPCDHNGAAALNHMQSILKTAITKYNKPKE